MSDKKGKSGSLNRRSFLAYSGAGLAAMQITIPGSA